MKSCDHKTLVTDSSIMSYLSTHKNEKLTDSFEIIEKKLYITLNKTKRSNVRRILKNATSVQIRTIISKQRSINNLYKELINNSKLNEINVSQGVLKSYSKTLTLIAEEEELNIQSLRKIHTLLELIQDLYNLGCINYNFIENILNITNEAFSNKDEKFWRSFTTEALLSVGDIFIVHKHSTRGYSVLSTISN